MIWNTRSHTTGTFSTIYPSSDGNESFPDQIYCLGIDEQSSSLQLIFLLFLSTNNNIKNKRRQ
jgi:hypothetical protein